MRVGEVVGLRWKNIILNEKNGFEDAKLEVVEQLQRVSLNSLTNIKARLEDIKFVFPVIKQTSSTRLVLKTPKTECSIRHVWIPETICKLLVALREQQQQYKRIYHDDYEDYGLVITNPNGRPVESNRILEMLKELLEESGLPEVDFHSLRHTSTTFKLIITNGDIKAVQGDNGQAVSAMVTDTYSFILDSNRKNNADLFEREFFGDDITKSGNELTDMQLESLISSLSSNPKMLDKISRLLSQNEM